MFHDCLIKKPKYNYIKIKWNVNWNETLSRKIDALMEIYVTSDVGVFQRLAVQFTDLNL